MTSEGSAEIEGLNCPVNEIGRRDALGLFFGASAALALSACSSDASIDGTERATTPTTPDRPAIKLEDAPRDLTLNLWAEPTTAEITPGITTDVYSFGATAFHLASGRPPFNEGSIVDAHLRTPPPDLLDIEPQLNPRLAELIHTCLEKDPNLRFKTGSELHHALKSLT